MAMVFASGDSEQSLHLVVSSFHHFGGIRLSPTLNEIASSTRNRFLSPTILLRIHYFVHNKPISIDQIEPAAKIKSRSQSLP
jgi:hypothetical protein